MKLAWLVRKNYAWAIEDEPWLILFEKPNNLEYTEVIPIVYSKLESE